MAEKLKIGVISSPVITAPIRASRVPPGWSGSPEQVMLNIADGLAERGHEVTLFATGETETKANLVWVSKKSCYEDPEVGLEGHKEVERKLIETAFDMAMQGEFQIMHSGFLHESADGARRLRDSLRIPTVATLHAPLFLNHTVLDLQRVADAQAYVSISDRQREGGDFMNFVDTIYHGVDTTRYGFNPIGGDDLLMVGRMHEDKGPHLAVMAAQYHEWPVDMVGSNWGDKNKPWGRDTYWDDVLRMSRYTPEAARFVGHVDPEQTIAFFQNAKVHLNPLQWEEPFGLTTIESMSCGTPVVAFALGSQPELIKDGVTGFLVNADEGDIRGNWRVRQTGFKGFLEALDRIKNMKDADYLQMREDCRRHVEANFSLDRMIDRYEELYYKLLS